MRLARGEDRKRRSGRPRAGRSIVGDGALEGLKGCAEDLGLIIHGRPPEPPKVLREEKVARPGRKKGGGR